MVKASQPPTSPSPTTPSCLTSTLEGRPALACAAAIAPATAAASPTLPPPLLPPPLVLPPSAAASALLSSKLAVRQTQPVRREALTTVGARERAECSWVRRSGGRSSGREPNTCRWQREGRGGQRGARLCGVHGCSGEVMKDRIVEVLKVDSVNSSAVLPAKPYVEVVQGGCKASTNNQSRAVSWRDGRRQWPRAGGDPGSGICQLRQP